MRPLTVLSDNYSVTAENIVHVKFAIFFVHSPLEIFYNLTSRYHHQCFHFACLLPSDSDNVVMYSWLVSGCTILI